MVLITGSRRMWLISMAVSVAIFGVLYFTVIKPNSDTANQAVKSGLQQSQQVLKQGQQQLRNASSQAGAISGQAGAAPSDAQAQLSNAEKLTACVAAAGTDVAKVQACQVHDSK